MRYNGYMSSQQMPMASNQPMQKMQGWDQGSSQYGYPVSQSMQNGYPASQGMQNGYPGAPGMYGGNPHQQGGVWNQKPGNGWMENLEGVQSSIPHYQTDNWSQQQGEDWSHLPKGAQEWPQPKGQNWNYTNMRPDGPSQYPQQQYSHHQQNQSQKHHPSYEYTPKEPTDKQVQQSVGKKYQQLKREVLETVRPWVRYGMSEAEYTSYEHAFTEVAAITYLIGKGYEPREAHYIVESWEKNEKF